MLPAGPRLHSVNHKDQLYRLNARQVVAQGEYERQDILDTLELKLAKKALAALSDAICYTTVKHHHPCGQVSPATLRQLDSATRLEEWAKLFKASREHLAAASHDAWEDAYIPPSIRRRPL